MAETPLSPFSGRRILKVHELAAEMRRSLERKFSDLWVEGELADLVSPQSGHLYFTLKDAAAKMKGVIFRSHLRFLRFMPKAGESVLIRGRLSLYEARGEIQLICDYIEPRGAGALQAAFEDLKKRLQEEGLFNADRKRPMPIYPARVGLITSSSGAAIQDILKVIREGGFKCALLVHPVPVQGWGAAEKIAHALDAINRSNADASDPIDLLILARGGGSLEDLWAFNEEIVVRAAAESDLPLITCHRAIRDSGDLGDRARKRYDGIGLCRRYPCPDPFGCSGNVSRSGDGNACVYRICASELDRFNIGEDRREAKPNRLCPAFAASSNASDPPRPRPDYPPDPPAAPGDASED